MADIEKIRDLIEKADTKIWMVSQDLLNKGTPVGLGAEDCVRHGNKLKEAVGILKEVLTKLNTN
ncbi:hypothetical protein HOC80_04325 [archaeon]|jgi:hypothetical protein|nr:hypothetical protein [archaeon]